MQHDQKIPLAMLITVRTDKWTN